MAVILLSASSQRLEVASGIVTAVPATMSVWFNSTTTSGTQGMVGCFNSTASNGLYMDLSGSRVRANSNTGGTIRTATDSVNYTINTWNHACVTFTSATARAAYLNGGNSGTNATSSTPTGINTTTIGSNRAGATINNFFSGQLQHAAIWNVVLTAQEILSLSQGYSPLFIRPQSLLGYWPLTATGQGAAEAAYNLTSYNTPTWATSTKMFMPLSPMPGKVKKNYIYVAKGTIVIGGSAMLREGAIETTTGGIRIEDLTSAPTRVNLTYPQQPNWLTGWTYRKLIVIQQPSADLSNYPVYVRLNGDAQIGQYARTDGIDVCFVASDGTTVLPYQRQTFSIVSNLAYADFWVKVPSITAAAGAKIYVYYGHKNATDKQNVAATWNGYAAMWHLDEKSTGITGEFKDLAGANNATGVNTPTQVPGKINNGQLFVQAQNEGVVSSTIAHNIGTGDFAIEAWVNPTSFNATYGNAIYENGTFAPALSINPATPGQIAMFWGAYFNSGVSISNGTWSHVVLQRVSGQIQFFVNGTQAPNTFTNTTSMANAVANIGYDSTGDGQDGVMDEVRLSNISRSAAWWAFQYQNINASVLTFGSVDRTPMLGPAMVSGEAYWKRNFIVMPTGGAKSGGTAMAKPYLPFISAGMRINWLAGYTYRKRINVSTAHLDSNLTAFPLYVPISDANIGATVLASGYDIRFTTSNGMNLLLHEREVFSISGGVATGAFWVNIDLATTGTYFYLYYGNSAAQDASTPTSVWDNNYLAVYHFPNGTTLSVADSSNKGNHGTIYPTCTPTTGIADGALSFDGVAGYVGLPNSNNLNFAVGQGFTFEAWIKLTDQYAPIVSMRDEYNASFPNQQNSDIDFCVGFNGSGTSTVGHFLPLMRYNDGTGIAFFTTTVAVNDGNWHHCVFVYDPVAQQIRAYVDGAVWTLPQTATGSIITNSVSNRNRNIGREGFWQQGDQTGNADQQRYFPGTIDELRISGSVRTAAWLKFEYWNINNVGNELSINTQELPPAAYLVSGTADSKRRYTYAGTGGIIIGGTAYVKRGFVYMPVYGVPIKVSGTGHADWYAPYRFLAGLFKVDGSLTIIKRGFFYVPTGGIKCGGTSHPDWSTRYGTTGVIILGFNAKVVIVWASRWITTGAIHFGIAATAHADWYAPYRFLAGGIKIGGTCLKTWYAPYRFLAGGMVLNSTAAPYKRGFRYSPMGGIIIGGTATPTKRNYFYSPVYGISIKISGTCLKTWYAFYRFLAGGIKITGLSTAKVAWGTAYYPATKVIFGGTSHPDWSTRYGIVGTIILGFNATVKVVWSSSWTTTGTIRVGIAASAVSKWGTTYRFVSGGMVLNSTAAPYKRGFAYMPTGGIKCSGTGHVDWYAPYRFLAGGIKMGGTAAPYKRGFIYISTGRIVLGGTGAPYKRSFVYMPVSGISIKVNSTSRIAWGTAYYPATKVIFGGTSHPDWSTRYGIIGTIILGFNAAVKVIWSSSWTATGVIRVGIAASAKYSWYAPYRFLSGGILIGGTAAPYKRGFAYIPVYGISIKIGGVSLYRRTFAYIPVYGISIKGLGTSHADWYAPYRFLAGGAKIGGTCLKTWYAPYGCLGKIIVDGALAIIKRGFSYVPTGGIKCSGTSHTDWYTPYGCSGKIIVDGALAVYKRGFVYIPVYGISIKIGGTVFYRRSFIYIPVYGISIKISGTSFVKNYIPYSCVGRILIGGTILVRRGFIAGTPIGGIIMYGTNFTGPGITGNVTVGAAGPYSLASDTFTIAANSFSTPLINNIATPIAVLQSGVWNVGDSGQFNGIQYFVLSRPVTINGVTVIVNQNITLSITPAADTLQIFTSNTVFNLPDGVVIFTGGSITVPANAVGTFPFNLPGSLQFIPGHTGAAADWGTSYKPTTGMLVSGTSKVTWGTAYYPSTKVILGGASHPDWSTGYGIAGTIILGFNAAVKVIWSSSWTATGTIHFGFTGGAVIAWGTTYSCSGGIRISGSSKALPYDPYTAFGTIIIGGTALYKRGYICIPTGGIKIGGTPLLKRGFVYNPVYGISIKIGGTPLLKRGFVYNPVYGISIKIGGTCLFKRGFGYNPVYGISIKIGGTCLLKRGFVYIPVYGISIKISGTCLKTWYVAYRFVAGGIKISGTCHADWGTSYYSSTKCLIGGSTHPDWSTGYGVAGTIILGFNAAVKVVWSSSWTTTGIIHVGIAASAIAKWGTTYKVSGGIIIGGTAPNKKHILFIASGGIHCGGSSIVIWYAPDVCTGGIHIGGTCSTNRSFRYIPVYGISIKIGGTAIVAWGTSYTSTSGIYISGTSRIAWGTSYYPSTKCLIGGSTHPDWSTGFNVSGTITLGFNAAVVVIWSSSWTTTGIIHVGIAASAIAKWGTTYKVSGGIKCGSTTIVRWGTSYKPVYAISIKIGGTPLLRRGFIYKPVSGISIKISGTCLLKRGFVYKPVSGISIKIGGACLLKRGFVYSAVYGISIKIGGLAYVKRGFDYRCLGGILIGGTCFTKKNIPFNPSGGIIVRGTSIVAWGTCYFVSGGIKIGGISRVAWGTSYYPDVKCYISGGSHPDWSTGYGVAGTIILGFNAAVKIIWSSSWTTTGTIHVGISISALYAWGTSYRIVGIIIIGGTVKDTIYDPYFAGGVIDIGGAGGQQKGFSYTGSRGIVISGTCLFKLHYPYSPLNGIRVRGTSIVVWGTTAIISGIIIIVRGTSRAAWGTTYYPYGKCYVSGTNRIGWSTGYNIKGTIILGFDAAVVVNWATRWVTSGTIHLGTFQGTAFYAWGTCYKVIGKIIIGTTARATLALSYVSLGVIHVGGSSSGIIRGFDYHCTGNANIIVNGTACFRMHYPFSPYHGIIIFGQVCFKTGFNYHTVNGIYVRGTFHADWGTSYYPYGKCYVAGSTHPDWSTGYNINGTIIVGFKAAVVVVWSSGWTATGTIHFGILASALYAWGTSYIPTYGIHVGGTSITAVGEVYGCVAGIVVRGKSIIAWGTFYRGSGTIYISGTSRADWGTTYYPIAFMVIGGTSITGEFEVYSPTSGIVVSGKSVLAWGTTYKVYGTVIIVSGTSRVAWGTTYYPYGKCFVAGTTHIGWSSGYGVVGVIEVGFAANVLVNWATSWSTFGIIHVGIAASALYAWGTSYVAGGVIHIGGTCIALKFMWFNPSGTIIVGGSSYTTKCMLYDASGQLTFRSVTVVAWGTSYVTTDGIIVSGTSVIAWGTTYVVSGNIIVIRGTFRAVWGTAYYPYGRCYLAGHAHPDWATGYGIVGTIELGFDANVVIVWSSSWTTTGIIHFGINASALYAWGTHYGASGTIRIGGKSVIAWGTYYCPRTGIIVSGTSLGHWGTSWKARGFIKIGGIGQYSTGRGTSGSGKICVRGTSIVAWGTSYCPHDGIIVSGTSRADWGTSYYPDGNCYVSGISHPDWATSFNIIGTMIVGFDAKVVIVWSSSWTTTGTIRVGIVASALYAWGTHYGASGTIIIGGTSVLAWGTSYTGSGIIIIGGSSVISWGTSYLGSGIIIIGGRSGCTLGGAGYNCYGAIIVSGTSVLAWGTSYYSQAGIIIRGDSFSFTHCPYDGSGTMVCIGEGFVHWGACHIPQIIIIIGGTSGTAVGSEYFIVGEIVLGSISRIDWGTSYVGGVPIICFGTAHPDWATGYGVIGTIEFGFNANVLVGWSSGWVAVGVIEIGISISSIVAWGTAIYAAGTIYVSGTSLVKWGTEYIAGGVIRIVLGAICGSQTSYLSIGGIIIDGTSLVAWGTSYADGSLLVMGGTSQPEWGTTYGCSGTIIISGTSRVDWGATYICPPGSLFIRGLIVIYGNTSVYEQIAYICSGTIILRSRTCVAWGTSYIAGQGIHVQGTCRWNWSTRYNTYGHLIVGVAAHTRFDWATHFECSGVVHLGTVAGASSYAWGTHYCASGSIIVGGYICRYAWGTHYSAIGKIVISGRSICEEFLSYDPVAGIVCSGQVDTACGNTFDASGSIIVGGYICRYAWGTHYNAFGTIVISGISHVDWGTSYIAGAICSLSGSIYPDWNTSYFVIGEIIVGISAISLMQIHYESTGGIIIGINAVADCVIYISYVGDGLIILESRTLSEYLNGYYASGGILIGIGATYTWYASYDTVAGIIIGGGCFAHTSDSYVATGVIILSIIATAIYAWGTSYMPTGGILFCCSWLPILIPNLISYWDQFTEIDTDDKISRGKNIITLTELYAENFGDFRHRVFRDYGVGYFGNNFQHDFEVYVDAVADSQSYIALWALSNKDGTLADFIRRHYQSVGFMFFNNRFAIHNFENGFRVSSQPISRNQLYYISIIRNGTVISANIYTDAAHTHLFQTISTTLPAGRTYSIFYPVNNADEVDPDESPFFGYVQNHDFNEYIWVLIKNPDCNVGAWVDWGTSLLGSGGIVLGTYIESHIYLITGVIVVGGHSVVSESLSYLPVISLVLGGNSQSDKGTVYRAIGQIIVGVNASAQYSLQVVYSAQAEIIISGNALCGVPKTYVYVPFGGIVCSGEYDVAWGTTYSIKGTIIINFGSVVDYGAAYSGMSNLVLGSAIQIGWSITVYGMIQISGTAGFAIFYFYSPVVGISFFGSSIVDHSTFYVGQTVIHIAGSVMVDWSTAFTATGSVIIGFNANVIIVWVSAYQSDTGIILGLVPVALVTWGTSYVPSISIYLGDISDFAWGTATIVTSLIYVSGSYTSSSQFGHICSGGIVLSGVIVCGLGLETIGTGGIITYGEAAYQLGFEFVVSATLYVSGHTSANLELHFFTDIGIILSGISVISYGATYVVQIVFYISGSTQVDWSTAFAATGSVIIGFNANVIIVWVSAYQSNAGIILGLVPVAIATWGTSYVPSTGIYLGDISDLAWGTATIVTSLIYIGGSYTSSSQFGHICNGGIVVYGESACQLGLEFIAGSGLYISGNANVNLALYFITDISIVFNSETHSEPGADYVPQIIINVSGSTQVDWSTAFAATGSVIIGFNANVIIVWVSAYQSDTGIILGLVPVATVTWGTSYVPGYAIYMSGTSVLDWGIAVIVECVISIDGSYTSSSQFIHICHGSITIYGKAGYQLALECVANNGLYIGGNAIAFLLLSVLMDVVIVLIGESSIGYAVSYVIQVNINLLGSTTVDVSTAYATLGIITIGFNAHVVVDWITSYRSDTSAILDFTPIAIVNWCVAYEPSIVVYLGNTSGFAWGTSTVSMGGFRLDGSYTSSSLFVHVCSGGLYLLGHSLAVVGLGSVLTGGLHINGNASIGLGLCFFANSEIVLNGESIFEQSESYAAQIGIRIGGSVVIDWATSYVVIGGAIVGVNANVVIVWVSAYQSDTGIILGLVPVAIVIWGTSYIPSSVIHVISQSIIGWGTSIVVGGRLHLDGTYSINPQFVYSCRGFIKITGRCKSSARVIYPFNPTNGIYLGGSGIYAISQYVGNSGGIIYVFGTVSFTICLYADSGQIIISGNADVTLGYFEIQGSIVLFLRGESIAFWDYVNPIVIGGASPIYATWNYESYGTIYIVASGYDGITSDHWITGGIALVGTSIAALYTVYLTYIPTVIENYTIDYTLIDTSGSLAITAQTLNLTNLLTNTDTVQVYRQTPIGTEFLHRLEVYVDPSTGDTTKIGWWALSNTIDTIDNWQATNADALVVAWHYGQVTLLNCKTGQYQYFLGNTGVHYWLMIDRDETNLRLRVYLDAAHSILHATLNVTVDANTTYDYVWNYNNYNSLVMPMLSDVVALGSIFDIHYFYTGSISNFRLTQSLYFHANGGVGYYDSTTGSGGITVSGNAITYTDGDVFGPLPISDRFETVMRGTIYVTPVAAIFCSNWNYNAQGVIHVIPGHDAFCSDWDYGETEGVIHVIPVARINYWEYVPGLDPIIVSGTSAFTWVYVGQGLIVVSGTSLAVITSMAWDMDFDWHLNRSIYKDQEFTWQVGAVADNWYRIQTKCLTPTCEVGFNGPDCPMQTIQYIAASSMEDLCTKLTAMYATNPINRWPIDTVTKLGPTNTDNLDPSTLYCTPYDNQPLDVTKSCIEFTLYAGLNVPNVHGGGWTFLQGEGIIVHAVGGIKVSGTSLVNIGNYVVDAMGGIHILGSMPPESMRYFEPDGGIYILGSYDDTTHYYYSVIHNIPADIKITGTIEVITKFMGDIFAYGQGYTELDVEEVTWIDNVILNPINILPTTPIITSCVSNALPYVLTMQQNLDQFTSFADFLVRNSISMGNLSLKYFGNRIWKANQHYRGISEYGDVEKWSFGFEWSCTNQVADLTLQTSIWVFSAIIIKEIAPIQSLGYIVTSSRKKLDTTRILLGFDTSGAPSSEVLDVTFTLNTMTKLLVSVPYTNVVYTSMYDGTGIFNSQAWNEKPLLTISISQTTPPSPGQTMDMSSWLPTNISFGPTLITPAPAQPSFV